jgi:CBS domain-containing protein
VVDKLGDTRRKIKTITFLQNIRAQDIMTGEYPAVTGEVTISHLIRDYVLVRGWRYIIIVDGARLKGILSLRRIKSVPWKRWNYITVGDIMTPCDKIITAHPQQTADTLFEEMDQRRLDIIPVLEGDNLIGVVTRDALMRLVKIWSGLGV